MLRNTNEFKKVYGHFQWPRNSQEVEQMTSQEFHKLMEGFRVIEKSSIRPCTSTTVS